MPFCNPQAADARKCPMFEPISRLNMAVSNSPASNSNAALYRRPSRSTALLMIIPLSAAPTTKAIRMPKRWALSRHCSPTMATPSSVEVPVRCETA